MGIAWMYGHAVQAGDARQLLGTAVALCVPVAVAVNWTLLQHVKAQDSPPDMLGAVLIGSLLSAAVMLLLALPYAASAHDLSLPALLRAG